MNIATIDAVAKDRGWTISQLGPLTLYERGPHSIVIHGRSRVRSAEHSCTGRGIDIVGPAAVAGLLTEYGRPKPQTGAQS